VDFGAIDRKFPSVPDWLWKGFPGPDAVEGRSVGGPPSLPRRTCSAPSTRRPLDPANKRATCHTFRHFFAIRLLKPGRDIRTVHELLGRREVSTTTIDTHVSPTAHEVLAAH
jgi:integrase